MILPSEDQPRGGAVTQDDHKGSRQLDPNLTCTAIDVTNDIIAVIYSSYKGLGQVPPRCAESVAVQLRMRTDAIAILTADTPGGGPDRGVVVGETPTPA